jgi:hypothetical protein
VLSLISEHGKEQYGKAALGFAGYAGALLGGRMPTAALRASMARSADGSLRDRQGIREKRSIVQAGRGPLFRLASNRALRARCARQRRLGVVPRSTRTPSLTSAQPQPGTGELDQGEIVASGLLVASRDRSKAL